MPENCSKFTIQIIVLRLLCGLHNHNQTIIRCLLSAFEYAIFSEYENIPSPMTISAPIIQKPLNEESVKKTSAFIVDFEQELNNWERDHSFSTYSWFFKNLSFLTPWYVYIPKG